MSRSAQQDKYVFYLDECMGGNKIFGVLRDAGIAVERHSDHFSCGMEDEHWLPIIGQRGWVLLTQDKAILKRKNEILALRTHKVCAFIVAAKGLRGEEIGELIVAMMPKILRLLKKNHPPLIAAINRSMVAELREGESRFKKSRHKIGLAK